MIFDENTIAINELLDDSYFTIDIPPNAGLVKPGKATDYATYIFRKRLWYIVVSIVVFAALSLLIIYFIRIRKGRRPAI